MSETTNLPAGTEAHGVLKSIRLSRFFVDLVGIGLICCALMVSNSAVASSSTWQVSEDFWLSSRSGKTILSLPAVRQALQAWLASAHGSRLLVHYPGGEEGVFQAKELRDWLVSFGVSSNAIEVLPGGDNAGQIAIEWMPLDTNFELEGRDH